MVASTDEVVLRRDDGMRLRKTLDTLEESKRAPVVLHDFGGQSVPEIVLGDQAANEAPLQNVSLAARRIKSRLSVGASLRWHDRYR